MQDPLEKTGCASPEPPPRPRRSPCRPGAVVRVWTVIRGIMARMALIASRALFTSLRARSLSSASIARALADVLEDFGDEDRDCRRSSSLERPMVRLVTSVRKPPSVPKFRTTGPASWDRPVADDVDVAAAPTPFRRRSGRAPSSREPTEPDRGNRTLMICSLKFESRAIGTLAAARIRGSRRNDDQVFDAGDPRG